MEIEYENGLLQVHPPDRSPVLLADSQSAVVVDYVLLGEGGQGGRGDRTLWSVSGATSAGLHDAKAGWMKETPAGMASRNHYLPLCLTLIYRAEVAPPHLLRMKL